MFSIGRSKGVCGITLREVDLVVLHILLSSTQDRMLTAVVRLADLRANSSLRRVCTFH